MVAVIALLLALVLGPIIAISLGKKYGYASNAVVVVLLGAAVFPRTVLTLVRSPESTPYDVSTASLGVQTQVIAFVIAAVLILLGGGKIKLPIALVLFVVLLTGGMVTSWEGTVPQWSGYFMLVGAAIAFGVGWAIGREAFTREKFAVFFLSMILLVLVIQLGVSILQLAGVSLPVGLVNSDRTLEQTVGRVSGTIGHPANLSKVALLLMLLSLPFTSAAGKRVSRLAFLCVALAALVGGLTVSRANLIAMAVLLAAWILTFPGRARIGTRIGGAVVLAGAALVFAPLVLERFEDDAEGGLRPLLLSAAWRQLGNDLLIGTGPNAYIAVVGRTDAATASGYPVHNALLLMTAELGILLALLFFLPLFGLLVWGLLRFGRSSEYLYTPRVLVYSIPGLGVVLLTGWGMISVLVISLWMFTLGFLSSARAGVTLETITSRERKTSATGEPVAVSARGVSG
ncbi:hypothetical protein M3D75_06535 [Microbacterium enclense]|uniref:O-antigen ligase family protein n=1 Tax=Microbacterium enclense TaxID=993073 RepID=UPI0021A63388|nr:O-antigen ligase family protein [Microbacterium enclense]MCT2085766.1 hypothetical protein [Microbacterium enclense]